MTSLGPSRLRSGRAAATRSLGARVEPVEALARAREVERVDGERRRAPWRRAEPARRARRGRLHAGRAVRLRVDVAAPTTASRGRASLARGRQQAGGARALKGARDARLGVGVCGGALARRRRARGSRALRHLCAAERSVSSTRHGCEWQGWARGRQAKRRRTVVRYRNTRTVPSSDVAHAEAVLMNPSAK